MPSTMRAFYRAKTNEDVGINLVQYNLNFETIPNLYDTYFTNRFDSMIEYAKHNENIYFVYESTFGLHKER